MPSSARRFTTICVIWRVDLGIDPYGLVFISALRQRLLISLFVKKDCELDVGDVGIFIVNGARYCKQYYIDKDRNLTLVSANPDLRESNVYISAESDATVVCCGKVLLGESIPLPDYFLEEL